MEGPQRRLSAILAADVAGYSRLMGADEAGTLADLRALRGTIFGPVTAAHGGRVIKSMGDGWLVEFASATEAVTAASAIQDALDGHPRIVLRIGIHVGDIVHEEDDIFGDGVNIAARLQEVVQPGGIAISGGTWRSVRAVAGEEFRAAGTRPLKNIREPVEIFVRGPGLDEAAGTEAAPRQVPEVLILPFAAAGADEDVSWMADGLTDAVITALSRFSWFVVQSRNTSFANAHRRNRVSELARDLGADYVVDGMLRRAGNRVRVSLELLDADPNHQLWSGRFDGESDDPFELEDRISRAILAELTPRLQSAEAQRARFSADGGPWDRIMQGRSLLWAVNEADVARAIEIFETVIAEAPETGLGQADLAWCRVYQRLYGWGGDAERVTELADRAARAALAADPMDAYALAAASNARLLGSHESAEGISLAERAIALNPNLAVAHTALALGLVQQARYDEALAAAETALELGPRDPLRSIMRAVLGIPYMMLDRSDAMEANAREMVRDFPGMPTGYRQLAVALAKQDRIDRARAVVESDILRLLPDHTATASGRMIPFGENDTARQTWVSWLVTAGLPE